MKILKYILGIILLLAIIFFALGFIKPSTTYESTITVDKSLDESWAVMNDESKISEWLKDIKDVKHVSGTKGTVGAVTEYTFEQNGQQSKVLETIREIKDREYIRMDFDMKDVMTMDYKLSMVEKGGKTEIHSRTTAAGQGMFMRSMMSMMGSGMKSQEDVNMANLKKLINENKTMYLPKLPDAGIE